MDISSWSLFWILAIRSCRGIKNGATLKPYWLSNISPALHRGLLVSPPPRHSPSTLKEVALLCTCFGIVKEVDIGGAAHRVG